MNALLNETFFAELLNLTILLILNLVVLSAAYLKGFFSLSPTAPSSVTLSHLGCAFIIYLSLSFLLPPAVYPLLSIFTSSSIALATATNFLTALSILTAELCYLYMLSKVARQGIIKTGSASIGLDLAVGLLAWLVIFPVTLLFDQIVHIFLFPLFPPSAFPDQVAISHLKMLLKEPIFFLITTLFMILIGPIFEEILFRGFLQSWLRGLTGRVGAIVGSALIFALFHFSPSQKLGNIPILGGLFLLGLMLGFLYERQRSLYAPIGLHTFFNLLSVLTLVLSGA